MYRYKAVLEATGRGGTYEKGVIPKWIPRWVGEGGKIICLDKLPPPLLLSLRNNATKKTAQLDMNYFLIDTSPHLDNLNQVELAK